MAVLICCHRRTSTACEVAAQEGASGYSTYDGVPETEEEEVAVVKKRRGTKQPRQKESSGGALPKVLQLSDKQLSRLHRKGHGGVGRLMTLFRGSLSRKQRSVFGEELKELERRVERVVQSCV